MRPAPAAPLPEVPSSGPPSAAGGPWPADMARAKADAQRVLNSIDWSRRDIVIWVPDTGGHGVDPRFADAVHASWSNGGASLTHLEYPASGNLRVSVATGIATLKLVLAEIAARKGRHRVLLAGETQGAWVIGEALADAKLRAVVDRAVLFGQPSLARTDWSDGRSARVLEINDPKDHATQPIKGDPAAVVDALSAIATGKVWQAASIIDALAGNAHLLPSFVRNTIARLPGVGDLVRNAHDYSPSFTSAVEFLRSGTSSSGLSAPAQTGQEPRARRRASRPHAASRVA